MNQTKFDRRERRKAIQKAEKQQRREAREKLNKDNNPNGKPYKKIRKLKDGGIAFGKNYKIGRSGQAGLLILGIVATVMYMGFTGMLDEVLPSNNGYDYIITDDTSKTWIPLNKDGTQMTDSSGNVIKFTNENTYNEFIKRIQPINENLLGNIIVSGSSKGGTTGYGDGMNITDYENSKKSIINNFFFYNYLMFTQ